MLGLGRPLYECVSPLTQSSLRLKPPHDPLRAVGEEIEVPVGPIHHRADPVPPIRYERFLANHILAVQDHSPDVASGEGADKGVALPLGEAITGVEGEARGGDGGGPVEHRDHRPAPGIRVRDGLPVVVIPEVVVRPTIVPARFHAVQLVTTSRPVLGLPDLTRGGVHGHPLGIAVPIGEDLAACVFLTHEGVVRRRGPIIAEPDGGADVVGEVLRRSLESPLAHGHVQVALLIEDDARAEVLPAGGRRVRNEHLLQPLECVTIPASSCHRRGNAALHRGGVTQIYPTILLELGMEGDVQHPSLPHRRHRGCSLDRSAAEFTLSDQAHPAGALRNEDVAVGKKREAPGVRESRHEVHDLVAFLRIGRGLGINGHLRRPLVTRRKEEGKG